MLWTARVASKVFFWYSVPRRVALAATDCHPLFSGSKSVSRRFNVILASVPDLASWQKSIAASGFDVLLDPTLDTANNTGFAPATFAGTESGFEYDVFPVLDILQTYPKFAARFGARGLSANFRWGGDLIEMACAMASLRGIGEVIRWRLVRSARGCLPHGRRSNRSGKTRRCCRPMNEPRTPAR